LSERGKEILMSGTDEIADRIEREILIEAPIQSVWRLVSQPGWWIGDGDRSRQVVTQESDHVVVDDPRYGRFQVFPVSAEAPRHVAFRSPWEGASTLVEFFLSEADGGTLLRVVESGFASLVVSAEDRATFIDGNTKGWETQLGVAKRDSERASA
jgi:uncharacterized protein YndB with AHSA1/START domain